MKKLTRVEVNYVSLANIALEIIRTVMSKNADYGDAWQADGAPGWAHELKTKLCRLETLSDGRQALVVDENIEETLRDTIGYALLGLLYLEHEHKQDVLEAELGPDWSR